MRDLTFKSINSIYLIAVQVDNNLASNEDLSVCMENLHSLFKQFQNQQNKILEVLVKLDIGVEQYSINSISTEKLYYDTYAIATRVLHRENTSHFILDMVYVDHFNIVNIRSSVAQNWIAKIQQ